MDESDVANLIIRPFWAQKFMLPNYTPLNWWECDVFELSRSGYFTEYEIKLTLSDFKADADKEKRGRGSYDANRQWVDAPVENKHQLLSKGDTRGPVRFIYVAPRGMITSDILPTWAGLIEFWQDGRLRTESIVEAPRLHKTKIDPKVVAHAESVCYYRMHRLISKARRAKEELQPEIT